MEDDWVARGAEYPLYTGTPTGPPPRSKAKRRLWLAAIVVAWTLVVGLASTAAAWELFNRNAQRSSPDVSLTLTKPTPIEEAPVADTNMPFVAGLTEAEARQAIDDAGIDSDQVTVKAIPFAGEAGRVATQDPAGGTDRPAKVVLTVSKSVKVPDIAGKTSEEVTNQLELLGANVRQVRVFKSGTAPGTVVSIDPAVGKPLPTEVVIEVASEPGELFVDAMQPTESECNEDSATISGLTSDHAIVCRTSVGSTYTMAYALAPGVERFDAVVGQTTESESGRRVRVEVFADGASCATAELGAGDAKPVSCSLAGKGTVTLSVTTIGEDDGFDVDVAFVNAHLSGDPDTLDALVSGG